MRPATLILSEDDFLAQEALDHLRAEAVAQGYLAEEVDAGDSQAFGFTIETQSLFGGGRFVLVRGAEELSAEAVQALASWLKDPSPGIVLVLVASGAKGAKLAKLFPADTVTKSASVPPWKVAEWVQTRVRSRKRKITPDGAEALVEAVGVELRDLAAAIDRLLETTRGEIDSDAVSEQFHGVEARIYQFVDSVFDRDLSMALKRLRSLIEHGENLIGLLASLARHLRVVAMVSGDRRPAQAIAAELGLRGDGPVKRAMRQARNFSPEDIRRAYRLLADADLSLKSEEEDPLVLELAVGEIASKRETAARRRNPAP